MDKIQCPYIIIKKVPENQEIELDVQPSDNKVNILILNHIREVVGQLYEYEIRYCSNGNIKLYIPLKFDGEVVIQYNRKMDADKIDLVFNNI